MKKLFLLYVLICFCVQLSAESDNVKALINAAEKGDINAQMFLGRIYTEGLYGVPKSPQQANKWYLAAAKQGNVEAQFLVYSSLVDNDKVEALKWLKKSADNGFAPAQVLIGDELRVYGDIEKFGMQIFQYYNSAAAQSFPPGYYGVANCYYYGIGVPRDSKKALEFYKKAGTDISNALLKIAYCYELDKDYDNAFIWYQKAVDAGIPQAYNDIAYLYAEGRGVGKDIQKAHNMVDIAISKIPSNPNFYDSKGEIYLIEGNLKMAREMWNKVLQLDPKANERTDPLALAMNNSVDNNIPQTSLQADKTFALICANEDYKRVSSVPYAKNDGKIFTEYCRKTIGVPEKNIYYVENATLGDMKYNINLLKKIADAYNGEAKIIFYYAGHGIPDESQKDSYLLPVDGYGNDATSGYSLKSLYSELANIPSKSVLIFMDACFSGAQRDGNMLESARGVAIKPKKETPTGSLVVFSAVNDDETAFPYNEQSHGLFTYFLLKKLQNSKGDVTLGELADYIVENVRRESITINKKNQTPTVTPSQTVANSWRNMTLK